MLFGIQLVAFVALLVAPGPSAVAGGVPSAVPFGGTAAVGALFSLTARGLLGMHFCTGSVVDSAAGDLVITAAHCVAGREARRMAFVPGYVKGKKPYGIWLVKSVTVGSAWSSNADPDDDVALLVIHDLSTGKELQSVTGGERLGIGQPSGQHVLVIGYPDNKDSPIKCQTIAGPFTPRELQFDCNGFTTGTSGGPLLASVSATSGRGTVVGVIGGYEEGGNTPSVSYAAKLGANVRTLLKTALR